MDGKNLHLWFFSSPYRDPEFFKMCIKLPFNVTAPLYSVLRIYKLLLIGSNALAAVLPYLNIQDTRAKFEGATRGIVLKISGKVYGARCSGNHPLRRKL